MRGLVAGLVVVVSGCASGPKWAAATTMAEERFPSRVELATVSNKPFKLDVARLEGASVDSWKLEGPLAQAAGVTPVKPESEWEKVLVQANPAVGNVLAVEGRCYAREYARFVLAKEKAPGNSLIDFMRRRCGITAEHVRVNVLSGEVDEAAKDGEWLSGWTAGLTKLVAAVGTPDLSGIVARREGKRAVVVVAFAELGSQLEAPIALIGTKGKLIIRGHLARGGAERITALINHGAYGVETCKTLDALPPPRFAFECPVDSTDVRATLQLAAFDSGRLLGRSIGNVMLWPAGTASDTWSRPADGTDVKDEDFDAAFLSAVNAVRARAGLPLLTREREQSAVAEQVAPYYFQTVLGEHQDPLDADRIALGLMAGWEVKSTLVSSGFGSQWLTGSRDLGVLMEFVLDDPFSRQSLTNPAATLFAGGQMKNSGNSLGAVFATYVPMGKFDRKESEIAIITRLNEMRVERMLPIAQWTLWPRDEGAVVEARLASKQWSPSDALHHVLEATTEVAKGQVTGYVQIVDDLEHFQFPPEVLLRPRVNVFLAVGVYRGESWAHARYVVSFVLASQDDVETAQR